MPLISLDTVSYRYPDASEDALRGASLAIEKGEYIAVVGGNGSGKSTLVRLFDGLRAPTAGKAIVAGLDPALASSMFTVRQAVALVFQSPVDQIVSSNVEEDVAFGPSNLGLPPDEIERRVSEALEAVGMAELRWRPTRSLSGGQQQKLAIAGALAMGPKCLVFDEATSMLDPATKARVLELMEGLAAGGMAVVHVTHDMDDAARAERVIALHAGEIVFDGQAAAFFAARGGTEPSRAGQSPLAAGNSAAAELGFSSPRTIEAAEAFGLAAGLDDDVEALAGKLLDAGFARRGAPAEARSGAGGAGGVDRGGVSDRGAEPAAFRFDRVSFSYLRGTAGEVRALSEVGLSLPSGARVALVGRTGSGKSTALQLMNALIQPSSGGVTSLGQDTKSPALDARKLRVSAPLSIQRPESALFELYAADDVAFGPRNLGLSGRDLVDRVRVWMDAAGVPYDKFRDRMTRGLSGGEKRKLALAGVFALESEAVLLDEPTAALDPAAQAEVFALIAGLAEAGRSVVFATHSMEEAARADFVAVFADGALAAFGPPEELFYDRYDPAWGIALPFASRLAGALRARGAEFEGRPLTIAALREALAAARGGRA
ncbi:energy-coupling factor transporter ATPase [bacterium]|nr:energy-coupling factor transporter ATPase [bacterium]